MCHCCFVMGHFSCKRRDRVPNRCSASGTFGASWRACHMASKWLGLAHSVGDNCFGVMRGGSTKASRDAKIRSSQLAHWWSLASSFNRIWMGAPCLNDAWVHNSLARITTWVRACLMDVMPKPACMGASHVMWRGLWTWHVSLHLEVNGALDLT